MIARSNMLRKFIILIVEEDRCISKFGLESRVLVDPEVIEAIGKSIRLETS